jgi:hypothetical protein
MSFSDGQSNRENCFVLVLAEGVMSMLFFLFVAVYGRIDVYVSCILKMQDKIRITNERRTQ